MTLWMLSNWTLKTTKSPIRGKLKENPMDKLTEQQKKLLVEYMNDHDGHSWEHHAQWATSTFRVTVTPVECNKLFMDSMFG